MIYFFCKMAEAKTTDVDLSGKWKLDRNENFDEYMKNAGVGLIKRKLISSLPTTIEVTQTGDDFKFLTKTPLGSRQTTFTLGVVYPETNPMWGEREHRVLADFDGGKLVQNVNTAPKGRSMRFEREIVDGELVLTMVLGEMVAKRYFKKLEEAVQVSDEKPAATPLGLN
ncbi:sodium/calcium exchanger regulatory protein 1-like [Asterias amurensis]|uniref:sodium/calcium exchanger regulatory protein 1-like n=1 Tax=Asterias amurensis TaxID=7602 RepID=UPI003AB3D043